MKDDENVDSLLRVVDPKPDAIRPNEELPNVFFPDLGNDAVTSRKPGGVSSRGPNSIDPSRS